MYNGNEFSNEDEYPDLENHNSHMAHCLTEEVYGRLRDKETTSGFTINDAIQIGVDEPGDPYEMSIGCLAGDDESYKVFAEFFDQVIEARHNGYNTTDNQLHDTDHSSSIKGSIDLDNKYVMSCRVRTSRNIKGFALPPHCTRAERRKIEQIVIAVLSKMSDEYNGKYHALKNGELERFFSEVKFEKPISVNHLPSCMTRDWPDARGLWTNEKKTFYVKVNDKDHLRLISALDGSDILQAFVRWRKGVELFEKLLKESGYSIMHDPHLGYISVCPGNLGTSLRISVCIKLPNMMKNIRIEEVFRRLRLEKHDMHECTDSHVYEVSNVDRMGLSEVAVLQTVIDGVNFLICCEKKLEKSEKIDNDINKLARK